MAKTMHCELSEYIATIDRRVGEHGPRLARQLDRIYENSELAVRALAIIRQRAGERLSDMRALDAAREATPDWFVSPDMLGYSTYVLKRRHPKVEIESCSSGGGRVDLGILRYTNQVWTSDNTDAFDRLTIQDGFTHAFTPAIMMAWTTETPKFSDRPDCRSELPFSVGDAGRAGDRQQLEQVVRRGLRCRNANGR